MKTLLVIDWETRRHPDFRKWMGTDEKIERLAKMDLEQLNQFAEAFEIGLGNCVKEPAVLNAIKKNLESQVNKAALKQYGAVICSMAAKDIRGVHDSLKWVREHGGNVADEPFYTPPKVWTVTDETTEYDVILSFMSWLETFDGEVILGGFNIRGTKPWKAGFDIPVWRARCAMLGIHWPSWLPCTLHEDRYHKSLLDVCDVFSDGTCDQLLTMAGLPNKTASGAQVATMTTEELSQYNCNDVELERLLLGLVIPTQASYLQELAITHVTS